MAQRYGWSYDEIMWGVSYVNLNMMMLDAIDVVKDRNLVLHAENPEDIEFFKQLTGLS